MAEISLEEAQEQQQLKSRIAPFRSKGSGPTTVANTGVPESYTQQFWENAADGVGVAGAIVENYAQNAAKVKAKEIAKTMEADHQDQMLNLIENLHQTPLDNLDYAETLYGYDSRHEVDFRIGALNPDGIPNTVIKEKAFEDYEVPWRQKEELENTYNDLNDKRKEYILNELPGIMEAKIGMVISETSNELYNEASALFNNLGSYDSGELTLDEDGSHWAVSEEHGRLIQLAGDPSDLVDTIKVGGQDEHVYTEGLNAAGLAKLRQIMNRFDTELADLMSTGAISSEKAIAYQRGFTQEVLNRQFQIERSRDPDGAYLKVLNGDYYINRDLMWNMPGKKPGKEGELLQKISLNDLYTNEWMAQVHTTRRTEHERAMEEKRSEGIAILQQDVFTKIEQPEFMLNPNNTKDDVKAYLMDAQMDESDAEMHSRKWSFEQVDAIDGAKNKALTTTMGILEQEFINDPEYMTQLLGNEISESLVMAKNPKAIKNAMKDLLTKRLIEEKDLQSHGPQEALITDKERREFIQYGVDKLTRDHIQKFINHHIATNRNNEKQLYSMQLIAKSQTVPGRQQLAAEFFDFDENTGTFKINKNKVNSHKNRKYYSSDEEFTKPLMEVKDAMNDQEKAYRKANSKGKYLSQQQFHLAMKDYAQVQKMQMASMFESIEYQGKYSDPNRRYEDPFHSAVNNWAKGSPYLEGIIAEEGIEGLMTPKQRELMHEHSHSFQQMGVWLKETMPQAQNSRQYLEGILKELASGKNKSKYQGTYTGHVGNMLKGQLKERIDALMPGRMVNTLMMECRGDGDEVSDDCWNKKTRAYNIIKKTKLNGELGLFANGEELVTIDESDIEITQELLNSRSAGISKHTQADHYP